MGVLQILIGVVCLPYLTYVAWCSYVYLIRGDIHPEDFKDPYEAERRWGGQ